MSAKVSKARLDKVVAACASAVGVPVESFFVADHRHEGLSPGAYSIALEGAYEWPQMVSMLQFEGALPPGVFVEPINGWCLGVYPA